MGRARFRWPGQARQARRLEAARSAEADRRAASEATCRLLRETRVARGLSLADVERDTRINRLYLEALEAGRFEALPAPVYARGFIRSYARYLGLDPDEAVSAVPANLPRPAGLEPIPGLRRVPTSIVPPLNPQVIAGAAALVVLALIVVFVVPRLGGGDGLGGATATPTPTTVATPAATGTAATPAPGGTVPPFDRGETPNFIGVTREVAQAAIAQAGLTPVIIESPNAAPRGQVYQQAPAPGEPIGEGGTVTLFISQGP